MNETPVKIERRGEEIIIIEWSDGQKREYSAKELRQNCPCALCQETHGPNPNKPSDPSSLPILDKKETMPPRVVTMRPVGLYAYKIDFSDGHDMGIYTFDILRRIGKPL